MKAIYDKYGAAISQIIDRTFEPDKRKKLKQIPWGIFVRPHGFDDWFSVEDKTEAGKYELCTLDDNGEKDLNIANWELVQMKNCCGVCVSTGAFVAGDFRQKGLGLILNQVRIDIARSLGFGLLFCTDVMDNVAQQTILKANGWKTVHQFLNPRTNNVVGLHVIGL